MKPDEIRRLSAELSPQEACESLVARARTRGGFDNITVQVVAASPQEGPAGLATRLGGAVRTLLARARA